MDPGIRTASSELHDQTFQEVLLHHAPELLLVLDGFGRVAQATTAFATLLGRDRNDLIGRHYVDLVHHAHVSEFEDVHTTVIAGTGPETTWPSAFMRFDGSVVPVTLRSLPVPLSQRGSAHLIEVSESSLEAHRPFPTVGVDAAVLQQRLQGSLDREHTLLEFTQRINTTLDPDELYDMALDAAFRLIDSDACVLGTIDPGTGDLICRGTRIKPSETYPLSMPRVGDVLGQNNTAQPFTSPGLQQYIREDASTMLPFLQRLSPTPFASAVVTQMVVESRLLGMIVTARHTKNAYSAGQIRLLKLITSLLSSRLQSGRLYTALHQHEQDLTDIQEINRLVMSNLDVDASLRAILASAPRMFSAQGCSVRIIDGDALIPAAVLGETAGSFPERVPLSGSLAGIVAERAVPMLISDLKTNPRTRKTVAQKGILARGWAAAPLIELDGKPFGVLSVHTDAPRRWSERDRSLLVTMANATAVAYRNARQFEQTRDMLHASVDSLASAVDAKDTFTHDHSRNVAYYARSIAEAMELQPERIKHIELSGLLHDIGKIGIPDQILQKPSPLDAAEWAAMQLHTKIGERILSGNPVLEPLRLTIRYHHERWDGAGYPDQLEGNDIPLEAAIVALADAVDTMSRDRPYQSRRSWTGTLAEVERHAGAQFHPTVARAFLDAARSGAIVPQVTGSDPRFGPGGRESNERTSSPDDPRVLAIFQRVAGEIRELVDIDFFLKNISRILTVELRLEDEVLGIYLLDDDSGDLVLYGRQPGDEPDRIPAGHGITGWVARHGVSQNVPDVRSDSRFVPNTKLTTGSELAVPLMARGAVFGVINIESAELDAFTENDLRLMTSTADHLAHAIHAARVHDQFKRASMTDALTGLGNHRAFYEQLKRAIDRARADDEEASIAIMDVNQLKSVNDTYGHLAGDEALRTVARVLNNARRAGDIVCRYGGDEFAIILPATTAEDARRVVEFLETVIENYQFQTPGTLERLPVGSWGTATYPEDGERPAELVRVADRRMYQAKATNWG